MPGVTDDINNVHKGQFDVKFDYISDVLRTGSGYINKLLLWLSSEFLLFFFLLMFNYNVIA